MRPMLWYLQRKGMNIHYARRYVNEFMFDLLHNKDVPFKQKVWAWKRGFHPERITRYGLTDENHRDYMSEFEYYKQSSFKNAGYNWWIEDKLLFRYVMEPFKQFLPAYYFAMYKHVVRGLPDLPADVEQDLNGVMALLRSKGTLAAKAIKGARGKGFHRLAWEDGRYRVDHDALDEKAFKAFLQGLHNYIITDYVVCHPDLRRIYPHTPNAVRLITIHDPDEGTKITGSFIRFGTSRSGFVDNASAGGLFCGVDLRDGRIFDPKQYMGKQIVPAPVHPETGVPVEGHIPHWDLILQQGVRIGDFLSFLPYLTYDLVATEDGFKILEINSHGALSHLQPFYPFFKDPYQRKLFGR
ncbi:MAG: hypothetical protein KF905_15565 [Flavobacteriales bacterium]|nr:hypothetical protein [Flavobacteriales bacterium]